MIRVNLRIALTIIGIFCSSIMYAQEQKVLIPQSLLKNEDAVLEYIIDEMKIEGSIADLNDKEAIKENLREWNPQIRDWKELSSGMTLNIRQKIWGLNFSYGVQSLLTTTTFPNESSTEILDVEYVWAADAFYYPWSFFKILFNIRQGSRQDLDYRGEPLYYSDDKTLMFEGGFELSWYKLRPVLTVERKEVSYFFPRDSITDDISTLKEARATFQFANFGFNYYFSILKKGSIVSLIGGKSLQGKKKIIDVEEKTVSAYKFFFAYRQYLWNWFWMEGGYRRFIMKDQASSSEVSKSTQEMYSFNLGYTF